MITPIDRVGIDAIFYASTRETEMIKNSKQNWEVGQTVKVGFMSLKVLAKVATPGDWMPDAYALESNGKFYRFVPHNGIERCADMAEAMAA